MPQFFDWPTFWDRVSEIPTGQLGYTVPGALLGSLAGIGLGTYLNSDKKNNLPEVLSSVPVQAITGALAGGLLGYGADTIANKFSALNSHANELLKKWGGRGR